MKALVTGAGGFVGGHLVRTLLAGCQVVGTTYRPPDTYSHLSEEAVYVQADLTEPETVYALLADHKPDHIYHLAAQTFVPTSFQDPWSTLETNIRAQLNLLHGVHRIGLPARVLVLGSSEQYGKVSADDVPISEQQALRPTNPYSVSKVTQDMLGLQYFLTHNVATIRVRPFNHFGPGQSKRFVAPAFASQIAAIERGEHEPVVYVGNLDARRDFTDVRDVVRAYTLVMKLGEPGAVYNVGSGNAHSIQYLLDTLLSMSTVEIEVRRDPDRVRPVDVPVIACDPSKIRATTGWEAQISFEDSLRDVLNEWRTKHTE